MQKPKANPTVVTSGPWETMVRKQINPLQFGTVEVIVHEGRIVEIKTSERWRLGPSGVPVSGVLASAGRGVREGGV